MPSHAHKRGILFLLLALCMHQPVHAAPASTLDLFESGLYRLEDLSNAGTLRDPASLLGLMESLAGRFFDFAEMARRIRGPAYLQLGVLDRAHYQNRLRDRLFADLAVQGGLHDPVFPRFQPLKPVRLSPAYLLMGGWIVRRDVLPRLILFHFEFGAAGWRITDVSLDGQAYTRHMRHIR